MDEQHRAIVRQEDDERADGEAAKQAHGSMLGTQAFRWRKAMDRVDGEYIML